MQGLYANQNAAANFRVFAWSKPTSSVGEVVLFEGVATLFLNTVEARVATAESGRWWSRSMARLMEEARSHVNAHLDGALPDFQDIGLNRTWPIRQGFFGSSMWASHRRWAKTHSDVCGNKNCQAKRGTSRFVDFKEASRCNTCYSYRSVHRKERPAKLCDQMRQLLKQHIRVGQSKQAVCKTCGDLGSKGLDDECRCAPCYRMEAKGVTRQPTKDIKPATGRYTKQDHDLWTLYNKDVCGNCQTPRTDWFRFHCEESRCPACYTWKAMTDGIEQLRELWGLWGKSYTKDFEMWL